ncbi:hypothetical protein SAMN04487869_12051 [Marinobacter sp. DSM 26671]|uniref:hypothetical protein n=1 Tax=Marinobacter sp. DSM 26671 TaxID=1761793 RepID=UPI0008E1A39B|nr:hypothetical protein [Marinobacter sp. DSM 26671]SFE84847.1 hypothetical protein SAMN04487869_12051 [Marinobacter sp. DSM 26671]
MKNGRISTGGLPLVLFGLMPLLASSPAGAHGAPDTEGAPAEILQARITEQPDLQGLNAMILNAPRPGILLSYQGETPLTVLGTENEAFLRFTGKAVMVNRDSPSWRSLPNAPTLSGTPVEESDRWAVLSQSASFGWLDPRLAAMESMHHQEPEHQSWSISLQTASGETAIIVGELRRKPLP